MRLCRTVDSMAYIQRVPISVASSRIGIWKFLGIHIGSTPVDRAVYVPCRILVYILPVRILQQTASKIEGRGFLHYFYIGSCRYSRHIVHLPA